MVNPRHAEIDGVATVARSRPVAVRSRTRGDYGAGTALCAGIVDEAGKRGSAGALIITAGLGHGAGSMADATERAARKYGMRLVGS
mgnify:CR=1 FL=1